MVPLRSGSAVIGTPRGGQPARRHSPLRPRRRPAARDRRRARRGRGGELPAGRPAAASTPTTTRSPGCPTGAGSLAALDEAVKVRAPGEVVAVLLFDVDGLRDGQRVARATRPATRCSSRWPAGCARSPRRPRWSAGSAATSSWSTLRLPRTPRRPCELAAELREQTARPDGRSTRSPSTSTPPSAWPSTPTTAADPETLLQRADLAAHAAKAVPCGVQLFNPALESRSVRRLGLAADLRRALDDGELEVYFQPKVTLRDRRLVGVECLARWEHPAHGAVAPEDFVAVAEHTGQLRPAHRGGAARGPAARPGAGPTPAGRSPSRSTSPPAR